MKKLILSLFLMITAFLGGIQGLKINAASITQNYPEGFTWGGHDIDIHFDTVTQKYVTDFDITDYKIENAGLTYYVSTTGSDSNDGLTLETAFRTVHKAMSMSNIKNIYINDGVYDYDKAFYSNVYDSISVNIIGLSENVILTGTDNTLTWIKSEGYSNVYSTTRTNLITIFDAYVLFNDGWSKYSMKSSIEEVDSNPGSYYYNSNIVYIHTLDSRIPDSYIHASINTTNLKFSNSTVYLESIKLYGGTHPLYFADSNVYLNNVESNYSTEHNGITSRNSNVYSYKTTAAYNFLDGFNYHNNDSLTIPNYILEIDCIGKWNGIDNTTNNNNGTSAHESLRVIRINGIYHSNKGPNVIDINDSISINYGLIAYNSTSSTSGGNVNYAIEGVSETNEMYLFRPIGYGSDFNYSSQVIDPDTLTKFTVSFVTFEGSAIEPIVYDEGDKVIVASPTRVGYVFAGWYKDEALSQPFSIVSDSITSDITLYAKWIPTSSGGSTIVDNITNFKWSDYLIIVGILGFGLYLGSKSKKR